MDNFVGILRHHFIDAPEPPPEQPEVSEIDFESCRVTWQASVNDGGSDVTAYVIEKHDVTNEDTDWLKAATTSGMTSLVVRRLKEGTQYRCVNDGEPIKMATCM